MKILNGLELAGFIKERQLHQSRSLRQAHGITPRLAIVRTGDNQVTNTYLRLKEEYGKDIEVEVDIYSPTDAELINQVKKLNNDKKVQGIIIQLPLSDISQTNEVINSVLPEKDVDGLGEKAVFIPATAMAIDWLMAGYNINLSEKKIAIVGNGRLVGAPLSKIWTNSGYDVLICDINTKNLSEVLKQADLIVTATGVPKLITSDMIDSGTVVVDAGTASEDGMIVGDLASDVRERDDLIITPIHGGVGPLTVSALFDNVLTAARKVADKKAKK